MITFPLRIPCYRYYFDVYVSKTFKEMYKFHKIYCKENRIKAQSRFNAVVHCYEITNITGRGHQIGDVLFCTKTLSTRTTTHEMVHCALWHDRLVYGNKYATYGDTYSDKEEVLAHLIGRYTQTLVDKFYELGIY